MGDQSFGIPLESCTSNVALYVGSIKKVFMGHFVLVKVGSAHFCLCLSDDIFILFDARLLFLLFFIHLLSRFSPFPHFISCPLTSTSYAFSLSLLDEEMFFLLCLADVGEV